MRRLLLIGPLAAVFAVSLIFAGCATTGQQTASKMTKEISKGSATTATLTQRVDEMNGVLDQLQTPTTQTLGQTSLKTSYSRFSDQLDKIKDTWDKSRDNYEDMVDTKSEYIDNTRSELKKLSDPTLRQTVQSRRDQVLTNFDSLTNNADTLQTAYKKYIANLDQIKVFLKNALTPESVPRIGPAIQTAKADGESLKAAVQAYQAALNSTSSAIRPTT